MVGASYLNNLNNAFIIEDQWIASKVAQLNALAELAKELNPCAIMQEIINEIFAYIQARAQALEQQIEALEIVQFLLNLPNDLDTIIKWIGYLIQLIIMPIYQAYLTGIAQLAAIAAAIANLTSAITQAASQIKGGCVPTIPTIVINVPTPFTPPAPASSGSGS